MRSASMRNSRNEWLRWMRSEPRRRMQRIQRAREREGCDTQAQSRKTTIHDQSDVVKGSQESSAADKGLQLGWRLATPSSYTRSTNLGVYEAAARLSSSGYGTR